MHTRPHHPIAGPSPKRRAHEAALVSSGDPAFCESLVRLLALEGSDAERAHTQDEVIARLETGRFQLLFADFEWMVEADSGWVSAIRERWPDLGIVAVSSMERPSDLARLLNGVVDDCLSRQRVRSELPIVLARVESRVQQRTELARQLPLLQQEAAERTERAAIRFAERSRVRRLTLRTLLSALGARESETSKHSRRVARYGAQLADHLGLDAGERARIVQGALLHDLGKIGIPDGVLLKPGPLTEAEWAVMHSHPRLGFDILKGLPYLRHAAEAALCHHERWDGRGYPLRLSEGEIPPSARVIAVADALDAMSVQRPYRGPLHFEAIREEFVSNRGTQFDPVVVEAAVTLFRSYDDLHPEAQRRWSETHGSERAPSSRPEAA